MHEQSYIEKIFEHLENEKLSKAVMSCLRLSRHLDDHLNTAYFVRELYPDIKEVARVIRSDMADHNSDAQKYVYDHSLERWLEVHTMSNPVFKDDEGDDLSVLKVSVGEIDAEISDWRDAISDFQIPNGLDPYDAASLMHDYTEHRSQIRMRIKALEEIKSRIAAKCLNYAISSEKRITLQNQNNNFIMNIQNSVNNYFENRSPSIFEKLIKSCELSESKNTEDASLLLTEIRRAISSIADYFYPPINHEIICSDGILRKLGNSQYLNRIEEYLRNLNVPQSSKKLLIMEINHLSEYIRILNKISSKGVHSDASLEEARQGLMSLYFFLFNVIQFIEKKNTL